MKKTTTLLLQLLIGASIFAQIPTNGLISSYSFNQGNANDETSTNNGTVYGASLSKDRFGNNNKAYSFDGVDDYIDFGDSTAFQMGMNDFSFSFWMYYDSAQFSLVFGKRGNNNNYEQYCVLIGDINSVPNPSTSLTGLMRTGGQNRGLYKGDLSGDWHHITMVHDYDSITSLYVDGVFSGSNPTVFTTGLDVVGAPLVAGYFDFGSGLFFNGKIDDIFIYNRVLSQNEITSLFEDANPTLPNSIVESSSKNLFSVYPNPVTSKLTIVSNQEITYSIQDIKGMMIVQNQVAKGSVFISTESLAPGIYIIRTTEGKTAKFIKE